MFRDHRESSRPLYVGSVKSNIGHLEGASGLAGILKAIIVLEQGVIPPNIWVREVNPAIDTKSLRIEVRSPLLLLSRPRKTLTQNNKFPTKATIWPNSGLRRASVSSFGYGGANAHVVIEDACNYLRLRGLKGLHRTVDLSKNSKGWSASLNGHVNGTSKGPINGHTNGHTNGHANGYTNGHTNGLTTNGHSNEYTHHTEADDYQGLLVLSAADEDGPKRLAAEFETYIGALPASSKSPGYLHNLLHTLSVRRTHLPWRTFSVVSNMEEPPAEWCNRLMKRIRSSKAAELKFVFTGQGAQWARMGLGLVQYPVFKKSLDDCDIYLASLGCNWSVWGKDFPSIYGGIPTTNKLLRR